VLVTIDYFTRWTKVVLLKNMTHKEVIEFIIEHTINIFSLPQTLSIDQGTLLFQRKCENLPTNVKKLLNSSPYYTQNITMVMPKSSDEMLLNIVKRTIDITPGDGMMF
jgi:hypothetical protein